jgi:hypothetical protein
VAWLPEQPECLAVGTSFQWLRIYDVRSQPGAAASAAVLAHPNTAGE